MARSTTETSLHPDHILSTTDGETAFFRSIIRYRPRGSSRHFSMVGICKDLERELQTVIPSDEIWKALRACYDLDILSEMEPDELDEIERSKSTIEILRSKQQTFFREFQLPIHPTIPVEQSFQRLVDERRLENSSGRSSPEQRSPGVVSSPRRRTTNSLKLHLDRSGQSSKYLNPSSAKTGTDHRQGDPTIQEGMESDLTEQEDYEDDEDEDEDRELEGKDDDDEEEEEEEEEEPAPDSKSARAKKLKTSNKPDSHPPTAPSSRSRNTGNSNKASTTTATTATTNNSTTPSTSRSRTRGRWKK